MLSRSPASGHRARGKRCTRGHARPRSRRPFRLRSGVRGGPAMTRGAGTGLVHDALFYSADDELVATAAPFLRAGIEAGDQTLLVCTEHNTALLAEALDHDLRLRSVPAGDTYRRVPATIDAYRHMMVREMAAGTRRVRLVGEVDFGDTPMEWTEWTR